MKNKATSQPSPLTPCAVDLFFALAPEQQFVVVFTMKAMWEARHPRSQKFRQSDLLATPEQREAHADFERRVKRDRAEAEAKKGGA